MNRKKRGRKQGLAGTSPRSVKTAASKASDFCFELPGSSEANGCQNGATFFRDASKQLFEDFIENPDDLGYAMTAAAGTCGRLAKGVPPAYRKKWLEGCVRGVTEIGGLLHPEVGTPKGLLGARKKRRR